VDFWHEGGHFEGIYSEFLEIRECGKIPQGMSAKLFRGKEDPVSLMSADAESLDERKQAKLVRFLKRLRL
jgi:hypothetical protein